MSSKPQVSHRQAAVILGTFGPIGFVLMLFFLNAVEDTIWVFWGLLGLVVFFSSSMIIAIAHGLYKNRKRKLEE